MQTNYDQLKIFDVALISIIAVGVALVGIILFLALPIEDQKSLKTALQVFDASEDWESQKQTVSFVFNSMNEFYAEFYIAFTEVMTLPEYETNALANIFESVADYADSFAYSNQQSVAQIDNRGKVLGEMLTNYVDSYESGNNSVGVLNRLMSNN